MSELQRPALLAAIDTFAEDEEFVVLALKNKDGTRFESALTYDVFGSVLRLLISSAVQLMSCNPRPGGIISSIRLPDQPIPAAGVRIIQGSVGRRSSCACRPGTDAFGLCDGSVIRAGAVRVTQ